MKTPMLSLKINLGLLLSGLIMVFSGILLQVKYHIGKHSEMDTTWGLGQSDWSLIHQVSVIAFSFFIVYHIILHWKWYKAVITKNLFAKNQLVITLSIVFLLVAITGYLPWIIKLSGGNDSLRMDFIEIHDKIALILLVYLVLHVSRRIGWFTKTFAKLKSKSNGAKHHSITKQL